MWDKSKLKKRIFPSICTLLSYPSVRVTPWRTAGAGVYVTDSARMQNNTKLTVSLDNIPVKGFNEMVEA
jgi:hypothetical protein